MPMLAFHGDLCCLPFTLIGLVCGLILETCYQPLRHYICQCCFDGTGHDGGIEEAIARSLNISHCQHLKEKFARCNYLVYFYILCLSHRVFKYLLLYIIVICFSYVDYVHVYESSSQNCRDDSKFTQMTSTSCIVLSHVQRVFLLFSACVCSCFVMCSFGDQAMMRQMESIPDRFCVNSASCLNVQRCFKPFQVHSTSFDYVLVQILRHDLIEIAGSVARFVLLGRYQKIIDRWIIMDPTCQQV